jgi:hypothetical protein
MTPDTQRTRRVSDAVLEGMLGVCKRRERMLDIHAGLDIDERYVPLDDLRDDLRDSRSLNRDMLTGLKMLMQEAKTRPNEPDSPGERFSRAVIERAEKEMEG